MERFFLFNGEDGFKDETTTEEINEFIHSCMPRQPQQATTIQHFDYRAYQESCLNGINKDLKEIAKQEIKALQERIEQLRNAGMEQQAQEMEQEFNWMLWVVEPAIVVGASVGIGFASVPAGCAVGGVGLVGWGVYAYNKHQKQQEQHHRLHDQ